MISIEEREKLYCSRLPALEPPRERVYGFVEAEVARKKMSWSWANRF
jgi:hypothetical protein